MNLVYGGLGHQGHDLEHQVCGGQSGNLGIGVVGGSDLDNIGTDQLDTFQTTHNAAKFARAPAAGLWGTGSRGKSRIEGVDVDGKIC